MKKLRAKAAAAFVIMALALTGTICNDSVGGDPRVVSEWFCPEGGQGPWESEGPCYAVPAD